MSGFFSKKKTKQQQHWRPLKRCQYKFVLSKKYRIDTFSFLFTVSLLKTQSGKLIHFKQAYVELGRVIVAPASCGAHFKKFTQPPHCERKRKKKSHIIKYFGLSAPRKFGPLGPPFNAKLHSRQKAYRRPRRNPNPLTIAGVLFKGASVEVSLWLQ